MLEQLRSAANTWIVKLLLVVLVVAFASWGISAQMAQGIGGNSVVIAGDSTVSTTEYRLAYDLQVNALSQRFGQQIGREQAKALGIDNQVLGQVVSSAVLDEQARKLTLGASDERIAEIIRSNPAFGNNITKDELARIVRPYGLSVDDFWEIERKNAIRAQIIQALADGMAIPDTFLHATALFNGEDRTIEYLTLPSSLVQPIDPPSDAVLSTWFEERKKDYAAPEYRKLAYVQLTPEDIADESAITDEQVRADYDKNKARFTTPETRTIEQLVFPSKEAADTALASLKSGGTFEKAVEEQGKTLADVQIGTVAKDGVPDNAVAEIAFGLQLNQPSEVIQGTFGPVLLRVTAINPEVVKSYEEAAPEIRKDLALAEAHRIVLDVHDAFEDGRAGGDTLAEAAAKSKLKVVTIDAIDQGAKRPDDTLVSDLPESAELLRAAFASEVGVDNGPVNLGSDGFVFYEVEGITPARDRTLDEVKTRVVADWTKAETEKRLSGKVAELEKRLKDGSATLDALATELSLEKQTKRGLKRGAEDADLGANGVAEVFTVAQDGVGDFGSPSADTRILFKVTETFEPAASGPDAIPENEREALATGVADDVIDQLVAKLRAEYDVRVDQSAVERALAF
jgi:peptidyl-prolyl cis-trans isomerase D